MKKRLNISRDLESRRQIAQVKPVAEREVKKEKTIPIKDEPEKTPEEPETQTATIPDTAPDSDKKGKGKAAGKP